MAAYMTIARTKPPRRITVATAPGIFSQGDRSKMVDATTTTKIKLTRIPAAASAREESGPADMVRTHLLRGPAPGDTSPKYVAARVVMFMDVTFPSMRSSNTIAMSSTQRRRHRGNSGRATLGRACHVASLVVVTARPFLTAFEFEVAVLCGLVPPLKRVASRADGQVNVGAVNGVDVNPRTASPIDACSDVVAARRYLDRELAAAADLTDEFAVDPDVVPAQEVTAAAPWPVNENPCCHCRHHCPLCLNGFEVIPAKSFPNASVANRRSGARCGSSGCWAAFGRVLEISGESVTGPRTCRLVRRGRSSKSTRRRACDP